MRTWGSERYGRTGRGLVYDRPYTVAVHTAGLVPVVSRYRRDRGRRHEKTEREDCNNQESKRCPPYHLGSSPCDTFRNCRRHGPKRLRAFLASLRVPASSVLSACPRKK